MDAAVRRADVDGAVNPVVAAFLMDALLDMQAAAQGGRWVKVHGRGLFRSRKARYRWRHVSG